MLERILWIMPVVAIAACVGDSTTVTDGGADGASDVTTMDVAVDVATDAAPVMCAVTKAFGSPTLITSLSTNGNQSDLHLTQDYATGVFNASRDGGLGGNDIFLTTRDDGGTFSNVIDVSQINSAADDYYPTISADGKTLIFASDREGGADDLWVATRTSTLTTFNAPSTASIDTTNSENTPFLREDGLKLYFASNRTPTQGLDDIWVSTVTGGNFDPPTHIDELAAAGSDSYPVVTSDDLVIYFASDRTGGKGGADIWVATRTSTSAPFGNITVVGELNTNASDFPSFITRDRCTIYLSSGTSGHFDLYVATKTP